MVTASLVLFNTPFNQVKTIVDCVVQSNCITKLYVIENSEEKKYRDFCSDYSIIEYIENENTGYGSSHNIALHKAVNINSEYHLILNPDIEFDSSVLKKIVEYMDLHDDVVYLLPKVFFPNGNEQYLCKLLPTPFDLFLRRFFSKLSITDRNDNKYLLKQSGYNKIINPPCLSGCFMFLRLKAIKENNIYFDERYFMYLEDFDLIRNLHRVGKTIFFPEVSIIHNHAKESYKNRKLMKIHIQSAIKYFNKYGWLFDKERKEMNSQILREIENMNYLDN